MWRPKNWHKYEQFDMSPVCDNKDAKLIDIFEAGADAMLEVLQKSGLYFHTKDMFVAYGVEKIVPRNSKGYLVFIPEEK